MNTPTKPNSPATSETLTPLTDKETIVQNSCFTDGKVRYRIHVDASFARKLERRLNKLTKAGEEMAKCATPYNRDSFDEFENLSPRRRELKQALTNWQQAAREDER
jgi:hypothetical protein